MDESGGQVAVFGRIGSRPFNVEEMQKMYMNLDGTPWFVSDAVDTPLRRESKAAKQAKSK